MSDTAEDLERQLLANFHNSYPAYARNCLQIRQKDGRTVPLSFNRSQQMLDEKIAEQLARTGRVRVLVLKSRQVGISTYFSGRSYWKVSFNTGTKAFVLTQEDDTTNALFGMVKRFHEFVPDFVRPVAGASNAKELVFNRMDSGYLVSTAGNKSTGRGHTIQVFHGSEVSRWPNADEHIAGVMQAIPALPGTEVYLESTANGVNNTFHKMWIAAIKGESDFLPIFIPWFWHEEYERVPEPDWRPPHEFAKYADAHELNRNQLFWAYKKNEELATSTGSPRDEICWLFRQEYPATAEEAFTTASRNSFIRGELVQKARRTHVVGAGPIVLGVDVARGGADKSALIDRQGRKLGGHIFKKYDYGKDTMPLVGEIVKTVRDMRLNGTPIAKIIVDSTGVGGPVFDLLRERLGEKLVLGIEFGGAANDRDRFANRRSEMWHTMMEWFQSSAGCGMPDSEELQADLCAPALGDGKEKGQTRMTRYRSDGALVMEEKDNIKTRTGSSPDFGDAAALTFAVSYDEFVPIDDAPPALPPIEGAWML